METLDDVHHMQIMHYNNTVCSIVHQQYKNNGSLAFHTHHYTWDNGMKSHERFYSAEGEGSV